ncbi:MAG: YciI family protein [Deltaproteobacteria bacterium]|nr:YciI family protein [Deltaproteobacteria bacterium]
MKLIVFVKASQDSEAGKMPEQELLMKMGKFNEEMAKAGILLDGAGLKPSKAGSRIRWSGGKTTVVDGPFAETKELVSGYWILQCKTKEECIEWLKRAPFGEGAEVEVRPYFEMEDFNMSPENKEQQDRIIAAVAERQKQ